MQTWGSIPRLLRDPKLNFNMAQQTPATLVRLHRLLKGMSQGVTARAAGRSQAWLSQLELGYRAPTQADLERIARALDVAPTDLMTDDDSGTA